MSDCPVPVAVPIDQSREQPMEVPIKAVIRREPDGGYTAEVPALPGCVTEGKTSTAC